MDMQDPAFQRRAIFQGLAPFFKRHDLFQVLWQWQDKYANTQTPPLNVFVQEICQRHGLNEQRAEVYQNLLAAIQNDSDQLGPDPLTEMMQHRMKGRGAEAVAEEKVPASTLVFCRVLGDFFDTISFESLDLASRCKNYLSHNLSQVVASRDRDALVSWLLYPKMQLNRVLTLESMRGAMHISYIGACEYLGPVKADRYLAAAIKKAEEMQEAIYFSPRQLL